MIRALGSEVHMNRKEAYSNIIQYKNNKRSEEESNKLEHGFLSNFKPKYLEKIPLGNGKFRYIYEEVKDKVKSAVNSVSNLVKTGTTSPGKITANEKSVRSSSAQAREAIAKRKESAARKAANEAINKRTIEESKKAKIADEEAKTAAETKAREDRFNSEMAKNGNKSSENEYTAMEIADEEIAAVAKKDGFDIEDAWGIIGNIYNQYNPNGPKSLSSETVRLNLKEKNDLINKVEKYHKDYLEKIKSTPDSAAKREILKVEEEYLDYLNDVRNKMNDTEKIQNVEEARDMNSNARNK